MAVENSLAFYDTATITVTKCLKVLTRVVGRNVWAKQKNQCKWDNQRIPEPTRAYQSPPEPTWVEPLTGLLSIGNLLANNDTATITAVKCLKVQAPGISFHNLVSSEIIFVIWSNLQNMTEILVRNRAILSWASSENPFIFSFMHCHNKLVCFGTIS
jgi:hypothetical protein